jgi:hypothetical protein
VADIVISRTDRHPGNLDWNTLRRFAHRAVFVGLEEEYRAFCASCFPVEFHNAGDLVAFAQVVAGAKLFVGNQSFGLALADAMSVPRLVQRADDTPNHIAAANAHPIITRNLVEAYVQS